MNCKNCGSPLTAEDRFCRNCGATVNEQIAQSNQNLSDNNNRFIFENQNNSNMQSNVENYNQSMNNSGNNYTQPMNNNGNNYTQPMNNYNNNYGNNQNNNSARNIIFIVAGVIVVIIIAVIAVIAIMKFNGKNNNTDVPNSGNSTNAPTGTPTTNVTSSYKVSFMKFTFTIPDTMDYEIDDDTLFIGDLDGTWMIQLTIFSGNFSVLKGNRYAVQTGFLSEGVTASTPEVKTLGGHEYLTLELSTIGDRALGAYTQLNSTNIAWILVTNQDNQIDYNILEKITPIITSAKYGNSTSNMESTHTFDIDVNKITELAQ